MPCGDQALGSFVVQMLALRLKIGAAIATYFWALIPIDAKPFESIKNGLKCLGPVPFGIGIIDAQNELAAIPLREQPVEQRRANTANMQVTCGAGGKASTDRTHCEPRERRHFRRMGLTYEAVDSAS
jgi:hypothetical protein